MIAQDLVAELAKHPELKGITIEAKGPYINLFSVRNTSVIAVKDAVKPGYGSLAEKRNPCCS